MTVTAERPSLRSRVRSRPYLAAGAGVVVLAAVTFVLVWFQPQALLFDSVVDEDFPAPGAPISDDANAAVSEGSLGEDVSTDGTDAAHDEAGDGEAGGGEAGGGEVGDGEVEDGEIAMSEPDATVDPGEVEEAPTAQPAGPVARSSGSFSSRNRYEVEGTATLYELDDGSVTLRLEDFAATNGPDLFVYLTAADAADEDSDLDADAIDLGVLKGNIGNQNYDVPADVDLDRYDTVVIWCRRFTVGFGAADLAPA